MFGRDGGAFDADRVLTRIYQRQNGNTDTAARCDGYDDMYCLASN